MPTTDLSVDCNRTTRRAALDDNNDAFGVFRIGDTVEMDEVRYPYLNMTSLRLGSTDAETCTGDIVEETCKVCIALLNVPITVEGNVITTPYRNSSG